MLSARDWASIEMAVEAQCRVGQSLVMEKIVGWIEEKLGESDLIDVGPLGPISRQIVNDRRVIRHAFLVEQFGHGDCGHDLTEAGDMHAHIRSPALASVLRFFSPVPVDRGNR